MSKMPDRLNEDPALFRKLQQAGERMSRAIGENDSAAYYAARLDVLDNLKRRSYVATR